MLKTPIGSIVLPGDVLAQIDESTIDEKGKDVEDSETRPQKKVKTLNIAQGISQENDNLIATRAGSFRHKRGRVFWVDNNQKRYLPTLYDQVIGIVTDRHAEGYIVDIGGSKSARLDNLAYPGATKRNKLDLKVGGIVLARVIITNKDMPPELSCIAASGKADGMGELVGGHLIVVSLGMAQRLLSDTCPVLVELSKFFAFETTLGVNGRVWVNSADIGTTVVVCNTILNSEFLTAKDVKRMVQMVSDRMK